LIDGAGGCGLRKDRRADEPVYHYHSKDAALRGWLAGNLNEYDVFAFVEKPLGPGDGNPLPRRAIGPWLKVLWVKLSVFSGLETELNTWRRGTVNGGPYLRFRLGVEPEKTADAKAHDQDDASQQRSQGLNILLE
jgi:hypothetical protein